MCNAYALARCKHPAVLHYTDTAAVESGLLVKLFSFLRHAFVYLCLLVRFIYYAYLLFAAVLANIKVVRILALLF